MIDLHLGDCLDILPTLAAASVDAVICDPPWGLGFDYDGTADVSNNAPDAYWSWFAPIYTEISRVVKAGGLIAIWQPHVHFSYLWKWFGQGIHIYAAAKNFVQVRPSLPFNYAWEPVVMMYKQGEQMLRPVKPSRNLNFHVGNTAAIVSDKTRIEKGHPCPRPLDTVTAIVDSFSLCGGTVLDPFMGSGTTGVACIKTGRNFIGVEREPSYFEIAQRRIEAAAATLQQLELIHG